MSVPPRSAAPRNGALHPQPPRFTKAGDWFEARKAGKRLPEHLLPEELETALATQRMEQLP